MKNTSFLGGQDESFNQSTWGGLQQAQEKYGKDKVEVKSEEIVGLSNKKEYK